MTIINGGVVNNYYTLMDNGWYKANLRAIKTPAQANEVSAKLVSDGRMERLKAAGCFVMGSGAALVLVGASLVAVKIASLAISIFVFPLAIIPPLYQLVNLLGGLGVGGAVGYITIKYANQFFKMSRDHWAYANHLFQEAHAVRLQKGGHCTCR